MAMKLTPGGFRSVCEAADEASAQGGVYFNWRLVLALFANAAIWNQVGQLFIDRI